ncbi:MAG: hypothetical protein IJW86_08315 [Clostridia bacterium]|nr:hypothetical protein [Clostridia bacterium]
MSGIFLILNIIFVWISLLGILISVGLLLYYILSKTITKKMLFRITLICVISAFSLYIIYFAGLYQPMKIDNETINRLLSIDIKQIDVSDFEEKDYPKIYSYVNTEYQIEDLLTKPYIEISKNKVSKYDYKEFFDDDLKFKIFGKVVSGTQSNIIIYPRESDRDFFDMYLLSPYGYWNKILVINENYSLMINYLSRQNDDVSLNKILDNLLNY